MGGEIYIRAKVSRNQKLEWACKCKSKSTIVIVYTDDSHEFLCRKCLNKRRKHER